MFSKEGKVKKTLELKNVNVVSLFFFSGMFFHSRRKQFVKCTFNHLHLNCSAKMQFQSTNLLIKYFLDFCEFIF